MSTCRVLCGKNTWRGDGDLLLWRSLVPEPHVPVTNPENPILALADTGQLSVATLCVVALHLMQFAWLLPEQCFFFFLSLVRSSSGRISCVVSSVSRWQILVQFSFLLLKNRNKSALTTNQVTYTDRGKGTMHTLRLHLLIWFASSFNRTISRKTV